MTTSSVSATDTAALFARRTEPLLIVQLKEGRSEVENQYSRVVPWDGNPTALRAIGFDAELKFAIPGVRVADPKACQCGECAAYYNFGRFTRTRVREASLSTVDVLAASARRVPS